MTEPIGRQIPDRLTGPLSRALKSWEALLLVVAVLIFIANSLASPYFLDPWNLSDATFNFTEKAMIAFAMAMLIIAGEIDLSVGSIIALASTGMGLAMTAGMGTPVLVLLGLCTGLACGAFNGFLVARFGLPSIVGITGTMSLFRGTADIVLGDGAFTGYPAGFSWFGQGHLSWVIMVELVIFALAANCLTSRLGSTRRSIAAGFGLEVATIVVLGGVSILGGSGSFPGVVSAAFVMGLVTFGLGLLNVPGSVMSIIVGALLIAVIALPRLLTTARR